MKKYFAMSIFIFSLHHALFLRLVFPCTAILRDLVSFFLRHLKILFWGISAYDPRNNFFRAFYLQYGIFLNRVNFRIRSKNYTHGLRRSTKVCVFCIPIWCTRFTRVASLFALVTLHAYFYSERKNTFAGKNFSLTRNLREAAGIAPARCKTVFAA